MITGKPHQEPFWSSIVKTETVVLKVEKTVNERNEIQPNLYTVMENDVVLFTTNDAVYALQAVLNRSWIVNKTIKQLADKVRFVDDLEYPAQDEIFERFAHLLIAECCDILSTYRTKALFLDGFEYNCVHPIQAIKNHFGTTQWAPT